MSQRPLSDTSKDGDTRIDIISQAESSDIMTAALETTRGAGNYYDWIAELVAPHLGPNPLEMGSGLGEHASRWLVGDAACRVTVTENSTARLELLRSRFAREERSEVLRWDDVLESERQWSSLVSINVIEHVRDDLSTLRRAVRRVQPGGRVILFAPAFPVLMSSWDRRIGHYRRYKLSTMATLASRSNLRIEQLRYVNSPGFFAWLLGMRVLGMSTGARDGTISRLWDKMVIPPTRAVERRVDPPFGQSVLLVARTE